SFQGVAVAICMTPRKTYRRLSNLRMTRLRNRSIATKRLDDEAIRRLDNLRYIAAAIFIIFLILFLASICSFAQQIPESRTPIAVWQQSRERVRDYIEYLKKRVEADPNNRDLQLDLARSYYQLAVEYDVAGVAEAEKILNQILEKAPSDPT